MSMIRLKGGLAVIAILVLGTATTARPCAAQEAECLTTFIQRGRVDALIAAKDVEALRTAVAAITVPDPLLDALAGVRMWELGQKADARVYLLRAIPRNKLELDFLYGITYPDSGGFPQPGNHTFTRFLALLPSALSSEMEPWARLLALPEWSDGDVLEVLIGTLSELHSRQPKLFSKALTSAPPRVRSRVCVLLELHEPACIASSRAK